MMVAAFFMSPSLRMDVNRSAALRNCACGMPGEAVDPAVQRLLAAAVVGGEEQARGVGRPGEAVDPAVQRFGEVGEAASGAFEHQQAPAVAFVAGAELAAPGDVLAVVGVERAGIGPGSGRYLDRLAAF